MTNHSPEPWTVSPTANPDTEFCLVDSDGTIICRFDMWRNAAETEQDANVRLMTAAPELLKALMNIDSNAAESVEWIRRVAREAIAKATGVAIGWDKVETSVDEYERTTCESCDGAGCTEDGENMCPHCDGFGDNIVPCDQLGNGCTCEECTAQIP